MYSLYRAWFGDSVATDNYSQLQETLSPPDTVVRVGNEGEHQFVAHKGVLAAHSGYLKALLMSAATSPNQVVNSNIASCTNFPATAIAVTTTNLSGQSARQPVTSVSVSSIGKYFLEQFVDGLEVMVVIFLFILYSFVRSFPLSGFRKVDRDKIS